MAARPPSNEVNNAEAAKKDVRETAVRPNCPTSAHFIDEADNVGLCLVDDECEHKVGVFCT